MHISMKIQRQGQTEQQMADANETILAGIADAGDYYASAQAKNLLNEYKGYSYQPAIILPSGGQQGLKLPEELQYQFEAFLFTADPNPSKGSFEIHYKLEDGYQVANAQLKDLSGKILKLVKLEGTAGTVQLPSTSLPPGIYLLSLDVGGKNLKTIKVVVSK